MPPFTLQIGSFCPAWHIPGGATPQSWQNQTISGAPFIMMSSLQSSARHVRKSIYAATAGLVGREQMAELMVLAAVAQDGAVDLKKLREGTVETDVGGILPEAEIVFLDN